MLLSFKDHFKLFIEGRDYLVRSRIHEPITFFMPTQLTLYFLAICLNNKKTPEKKVSLRGLWRECLGQRNSLPKLCCLCSRLALGLRTPLLDGFSILATNTQFTFIPKRAPYNGVVVHLLPLPALAFSLAHHSKGCSCSTGDHHGYQRIYTGVARGARNTKLRRSHRRGSPLKSH